MQPLVKVSQSASSVHGVSGESQDHHKSHIGMSHTMDNQIKHCRPYICTTNILLVMLGGTAARSSPLGRLKGDVV